MHAKRQGVAISLSMHEVFSPGPVAYVGKQGLQRLRTSGTAGAFPESESYLLARFYDSPMCGSLRFMAVSGTSLMKSLSLAHDN